MCGIVGFQGKINQKEQVLSDMMQSIKHRGPDDEGTAFVEDVSMGHVRLSIIDIKYGHQPMYTKDNRYTLVFNGEIYNFIELRQFLNSKGYVLQTNSDSEVILYMYAEYGKDLVNYLNGMFAFAIYDNIEKTLFLARDHFGIKPLYYTTSNGRFIFGSEIKALLKHPEIKVVPNQKSISEYVTFQFVLNSDTLFEDIYKLEPAHYMIVKDSRIIEKKEYWKIRFTIDESKTEEQFADELLVLLEKSLSMQIRSDVPVGAHLSGGIDSSTVAVLATNNYIGKFQTFTGGFKDGELYDETRYAKIISDFIGSEYHEIFPDSNDFINLIEKLIYHMDEPGAGPGIFPQYMVSKLASEHVKVVLGGQGGDEVFGGYARYAVAYLEQCLKGAIFETQEEGKHVVTLQSIIKNMPLLKQYIPLIQYQFSSGLFEDMDRRYFRMINRAPNSRELYHPDFVSRHNDEALFEKFSGVFNNPDTLSYFNKMTYFDMKSLLPTLLQVEDRMSMAVSLESRVPLLDRRIVELATRIPPTMKFACGKTKNILIRAVKNILPEEIINRKDKMGFPVPINEWIKGPLKEYIIDTFQSQKARERNLFNTEVIVNQIERSGKFTREIWGALNLELWHKQFID
jgi:asparagine synthase (glutamine-hydrolysing)